jgi:NitT/TauT family transport system ATP-binding protein
VSSQPIIELRNVSRRFVSERNDVTALAEASLAIAPGEFVTVVGPSGCGKSTILNIIVGLLDPTTGERLYKGKPFNGVNHDIGYVTQADNLFPWRTVVQNVEFGLELRGIGSKAERRDRAMELITRVGLEKFAGHFRHELSGGMRQRVNIVRTLAYNPAVLLLDEPFGPLDAQTRLQLQDLLLKLWQERSETTVVFITHDLTEAIALADRVVVMSARPGRIVETVPVDLPRPRDIYSISTDPQFRAIYDKLWDRLADEMRVTV